SAIALGMPKVVTGVFKGILLFMLLAGETFNRYHITLRRAAPVSGTQEQ
ncbi:MAG: ABC transporter permease, partial [Alphaproteobacteria bacterium]|nr:ABC transporter permease [Alphaproteobacteria bacterium]